MVCMENNSPDSKDGDLSSSSRHSIYWQCLQEHGYSRLIGVQVIGLGRNCEVFRAWSDKTKKQVAVKVIDKQRAGLNYCSTKLNKEISLWSKLRHPNVVKLIECINDHRWTYSVMDLAPEGDLNSWLNSHKCSPDTEQSKKWIYQITKGLYHLKSLGYSHGDVKPNNVLVFGKNLKICDFDCLKKLDGIPCEIYCGSYGYVAPEVFRNEAHDPEKADVWSLGVTAYNIITNGHDNICNIPLSYVFKIKRNWLSCLPTIVRPLFKAMMIRRPINRCDLNFVIHYRWFTAENNDDDDDDDDRDDIINSNKTKIQNQGIPDGDEKHVSEKHSVVVGNLTDAKNHPQRTNVIDNNIDNPCRILKARERSCDNKIHGRT